MSWRALEAAAPELARRARERLDATGVALLGTLRADGSPRISPIEPRLGDGELRFAGMTWSAKVRDLSRDPRCVVHSVVTGPDTGEAELKLSGRAVETQDVGGEGWWVGRPAVVYRLEIDEAVVVEWDTAAGRMTVRRWSPARGYAESGRDYP